MKSPATAIRRPRSAATIRASFRLSVFIGEVRRTKIHNRSDEALILERSSSARTLPQRNLFVATLAERTLFLSARSCGREKCFGQAISPRFPYFQRNGVREKFFGGLRRVLRRIQPLHAVLLYFLEKNPETRDLSDRLPATRRHPLERGHPSDVDRNQSHQHHRICRRNTLRHLFQHQHEAEAERSENS